MAVNIAVFASGSGSNAENLVEYFRNDQKITINPIFCNNPEAYVIERARNLGVESILFNKDSFKKKTFLKLLADHDVDFIVLAGFLWKLPDYLVHAFSDKIINLHPSLLPKYGGKGMYGSFVHKAVISNHEKTSGITIHLVSENYDEGRILFQKQCPVDPAETPDSLAEKIHKLEHKYFPEVIADYISRLT